MPHQGILDAFRLDGRGALVTGAARGIGQALALGLAEAGADLVVLDQVPPEETRERIVALGRRCHSLVIDLQRIGPVTAKVVVEQGVAALGHLDILVNNAGVIRRSAALDHSWEDWEATLDLDLSAPFYLGQAAARHFVAGGGGKIVNVVSMLSFQGGVGVPAYAAAKSGLAGLTRALANEWAPHGINVNAVAPGYVATDLTAELRTDPARGAAILARIPAGRWGRPADLQGAVVFLCSDAAAYVHGAILPVDGGWLVR